MLAFLFKDLTALLFCYKLAKLRKIWPVTK